VGIDARDGLAAIEGWKVSGGLSAEEVAERAAQAGAVRIIFTDIARDGALRGVNAESAAALARSCGLKVIASGGVKETADIEKLKQYEQDGIEGCIIGKALYTGALTMAEALRAGRGETHAG
jgi:phosphoribosylformimino-5-aminoimidazole carboxamide ribotide isomerase